MKAKKTAAAKRVSVKQEMKKPVLITIIVLVSLEILLALGIYLNVFAGKAIFFNGVENNIGIKSTETYTEGNDIRLPIKVDIGDKQTVAFEVKLTVPQCPDSYTFNSKLFDPNSEGSMLHYNDCTNKVVTLQAANIDPDQAETGEFTIAELIYNSNSLLLGTHTFSITKADIYDLETSLPINLNNLGEVQITVQPASACGLGLEAYPEMFITDDQYFNDYFVVGENASARDNDAMILIANTYPKVVGANLLDTGFTTSIYDSNLISVGSACVNQVTRQLLGNPTNCNDGLEANQWKIKLIEHENGKYALLVYGYYDENNQLGTWAAAKYLAEHTSNGLTGCEYSQTETGCVVLSENLSFGSGCECNSYKNCPQPDPTTTCNDGVLTTTTYLATCKNSECGFLINEPVPKNCPSGACQDQTNCRTICTTDAECPASPAPTLTCDGITKVTVTKSYSCVGESCILNEDESGETCAYGCSPSTATQAAHCLDAPATTCTNSYEEYNECFKSCQSKVCEKDSDCGNTTYECYVNRCVPKGYEGKSCTFPRNLGDYFQMTQDEECNGGTCFPFTESIKKGDDPIQGKCTYLFVGLPNVLYDDCVYSKKMDKVSAAAGLLKEFFKNR